MADAKLALSGGDIEAAAAALKKAAKRLESL